jgi:hypothetical protein
VPKYTSNLNQDSALMIRAIATRLDLTGLKALDFTGINATKEMAETKKAALWAAHLRLNARKIA